VSTSRAALTVRTELRQHFRLAPPCSASASHLLAGVELGRPFDHELLNERGPAGDDEEEGSPADQRTPTHRSARPTVSKLCRWPDTQASGRSAAPSGGPRAHGCVPSASAWEASESRSERRAQALQLPGAAVIERAPLRRGRLVLDAQPMPSRSRPCSAASTIVLIWNTAGDITVQVLAALLQGRVRQRRSYSGRRPAARMAAGSLHQGERPVAVGSGIAGLLQGLEGAQALRRYRSLTPLVPRARLAVGHGNILGAPLGPDPLAWRGLLDDLKSANPRVLMASS